MNIISSDKKKQQKNCYSKRNDFTKFFKMSLSNNKRSRKIAEIRDKVFA